MKNAGAMLFFVATVRIKVRVSAITNCSKSAKTILVVPENKQGCFGTKKNSAIVEKLRTEK